MKTGNSAGPGGTGTTPNPGAPAFCVPAGMVTAVVLEFGVCGDVRVSKLVWGVVGLEVRGGDDVQDSVKRQRK